MAVEAEGKGRTVGRMPFWDAPPQRHFRFRRSPALSVHDFGQLIAPLFRKCIASEELV